MENDDMRDKGRTGGMESDHPAAVFRINAVQLVVGVIFMSAGAALLMADIGQGIVGIIALIYGLRAVLAFARGQIRIFRDRLEVEVPGVSKIEVLLSEITKIERLNSSIRLFVEGKKKPVVLPWWIVRSDDVGRLHGLLEEKRGSHVVVGQET